MDICWHADDYNELFQTFQSFAPMPIAAPVMPGASGPVVSGGRPKVFVPSRPLAEHEDVVALLARYEGLKLAYLLSQAKFMPGSDPGADLPPTAP